MKYISISILSLVALFWFVFALLSGAGRYGGGLMGVLKNSPNAIPWLILFGFLFLAWKWELIGGIIIAILGVFTIFAFDTYEHIITFLLITLPLIVLGVMLKLSWWLKRKDRLKKQRNTIKQDANN